MSKLILFAWKGFGKLSTGFVRDFGSKVKIKTQMSLEAPTNVL